MLVLYKPALVAFSIVATKMLATPSLRLHYVCTLYVCGANIMAGTMTGSGYTNLALLNARPLSVNFSFALTNVHLL